MEQLVKTIKNNNIRIIAIDGRCASGKTTYAQKLSEILNAEIIHMDDFFLSNELKTKERLNEVGGNIDYVRFITDVLEKLKIENCFAYQRFDCTNQRLSNIITINNNSYIIIEGTYALHPKFINYYDYKIFMTVNHNIQIERLEVRNPRLIDRFINEWIPLEEKYFDALMIKNQADYIIDTSNI